SFCMCPGGWIVNSSTEPGRLATNGMSLKRRDSPYANAALIVTVENADVVRYARRPGDVLAGGAVQPAIQEKGDELGGGGFTAPTQKLVDLLARRATTLPLRSSYRPALAGADLADALPGFVVDALRGALPMFARRLPGFLSAEAQLVGVETRTSSPLRFL